MITALGFVLSSFAQDSTNTFDYKKGMEYFTKAMQNEIMIYELLNASNDPGYDPVLPDSLIQNTSSMFQNAMPYFLKAYAIKPKDKKILTALKSTYSHLYRFDEADNYNKKLEALNKK